MKQNRRSFLGTVATTGVAAAFARAHSTSAPPPERARQFPYVQIDVFSSRRLEGNPLAVFTDARGLSDEEMQALARETNLSETTFVFPRDAATEQQRGVQVRIFTTQEEVPFAGHPTLGTAMVLRKLRQAQAGRAEAGQQVSGITLDLKIGRCQWISASPILRGMCSEKCIRLPPCSARFTIERQSPSSSVCM